MSFISDPPNWKAVKNINIKIHIFTFYKFIEGFL